MVADIQKEEKVAVFSFSRATLIISKEAPLGPFDMLLICRSIAPFFVRTGGPLLLRSCYFHIFIYGFSWRAF